MISLEAALERMSAVVASLPAEAVSLNLAAGRWLSEDAFSGIDLPPFDNSAMDGYAVAAAELAAAASDQPANRQCAGETAAGQTPGPPLQPQKLFSASYCPTSKRSCGQHMLVFPLTHQTFTLPSGKLSTTWPAVTFSSSPTKFATLITIVPGRYWKSG